MSEMTKKLDHFTATILAEATAETERMLKALEEKRVAAHTISEDQILLEIYNYIHNEVSRIKSENGQRISRHMLEDKRALYLRRGEIARNVFGLVREKIDVFTHSPDYTRRLTELFHQTLSTLSGAVDIKVSLRREDMGLASALSQSAPAAEVRFVQGDFLLGGLIAESLSLGLHLDATFDSAIEALDGHFAELFGLSLTGDE